MYFMHIPRAVHYKRDAVERLKEAKFLGSHQRKMTRGGWSEGQIDVYYVANPAEGHSHYFGIFNQFDSAYICGAGTSLEDGFDCLVHIASGEVVISWYRHDYRTLGHVAIDGGRDYTRIIGDTSGYAVKRLTVEDGKYMLDGQEVELRYND